MPARGGNRSDGRRGRGLAESLLPSAPVGYTPIRAEPDVSAGDAILQPDGAANGSLLLARNSQVGLQGPTGLMILNQAASDRGVARAANPVCASWPERAGSVPTSTHHIGQRLPRS